MDKPGQKIVWWLAEVWHLKVYWYGSLVSLTLMFFFLGDHIKISQDIKSVTHIVGLKSNPPATWSYIHITRLGKVQLYPTMNAACFVTNNLEPCCQWRKKNYSDNTYKSKCSWVRSFVYSALNTIQILYRQSLFLSSVNLIVSVYKLSENVD